MELFLIALIVARWPDQAAAQARAGGVVVRAEASDSVPVAGIRVELDTYIVGTPECQGRSSMGRRIISRPMRP